MPSIAGAARHSPFVSLTPIVALEKRGTLMKVAVTGGTGFVGSHAVKEILARGHDVRLLVRSPEKVAPTMALHGLSEDDVEVAIADVQDAAAIEAGLDGCDAVVHAASVYSFDPSRADEMAEVNVDGMRTVFDAGIAHGLDPIVHVSSVVALLREDELDHPVGPDAPPGNPTHHYSRTKAEQERVARAYQDEGAPIVIVHPGGVWGPVDPYMGESQQFVPAILRGIWTMVPGGQLTVCDVRDVAQVLAAVLEPGKGPRRYSAVGHAVELKALTKLVTAANGRTLPSVSIPDVVASGLQKMLWVLNRRGRGRRLPFSAEMVWIGRHRPRVDNSRTEEELGVTFRPVAETVGDQVAWMKSAGRL